MTSGSRLTEWGVDWMVRLRWAAVTGILLAPAVAWAVGERLEIAPFLALGGGVAVYNLLVRWWARRNGALPESVVHAQILLDLVALTGVFTVSAGAAKPLLPMYGFHVVIAAIVLSRGASFFYAGLATGLSFLAGLDGRVPRLDLLALAGVLFTFAYLASVIGDALRRREASLLELSRSLAEQDRRKSQYVLMLGHGMLSRIEDVERAVTAAKAELPRDALDSVRGMLSRAGEWLRALHALVKDVVELSRIRSAEEPAWSYVYLPRLIYERLQELKPHSREREIEFLVEAPPHLPFVRGNARTLAQVLENLFRNALTYSPRGSTVRLSLAEAGENLELVVADEGIGIAPEDLPHVFEEFYRASRARELERSGTGLGLAIVKYVVEQHGGSVSVESEEGKGSRFTVRLPALAERPESHAREE